MNRTRHRLTNDLNGRVIEISGLTRSDYQMSLIQKIAEKRQSLYGKIELRCECLDRSNDGKEKREDVRDSSDEDVFIIDLDGILQIGRSLENAQGLGILERGSRFAKKQ